MAAMMPSLFQGITACCGYWLMIFRGFLFLLLLAFSLRPIDQAIEGIRIAYGLLELFPYLIYFLFRHPTMQESFEKDLIFFAIDLFLVDE